MTRSDRLRRIGWGILAAGFCVALVVYVVKTATADPVLNDANALGYTKSMQHDMGVMMGRFGLMLTEWSDALGTPAGEASLIVVGAALAAGYCFRAAWVLDEDARN